MTTHENKNWLLYGLGSSVSQFGSMIYSFAIGLYVLNTTGSGTKFATTLIVAYLPMLVLTPFAGIFADRFDRKRIVVLMDGLNGILFVATYMITLITPLNIILIYSTLFLTNVFTAFFNIAFDAAKPQLISKERLHTINSLSQIIRASANILGPVIGGVVYVLVDIKSFLLINGISFLISSVTEMYIDFEFRQEIKNDTEIKGISILDSFKASLAYLKTKHNVVQYFVFFFLVNISLSVGLQVPLPYILNTHFGLSPEFFGIINAMFPIGLIIGALITGQLIKHLASETIIFKSGIFIGFTIISMGLPGLFAGTTTTGSTVIIYYAVIMFILGICIALIDIPISTILQTEIDANFLGRVLGILFPTIKLANPVGYLIAGILLDVVNPFVIPFVTGAVYLIIILVINIRKPTVTTATYLTKPPNGFI